jgi:hypothetical protein
VELLCKEFTEIKFKPGECVEDFSFHITSLANELRVVGDEITNDEVVKMMLHSVPEKLEQVAISMETLFDLNSLSIKEAVGHLCAIEQRKKSFDGPVPDASGCMLLMEEEWTMCMKAKMKGSSSGNGGGYKKGHDRGYGCLEGVGVMTTFECSTQGYSSSITCYRYKVFNVNTSNISNGSNSTLNNVQRNI